MARTGCSGMGGCQLDSVHTHEHHRLEIVYAIVIHLHQECGYAGCHSIHLVSGMGSYPCPYAIWLKNVATLVLWCRSAWVSQASLAS